MRKEIRSLILNPEHFEYKIRNLKEKWMIGKKRKKEKTETVYQGDRQDLLQQPWK